MTLHATDLFGQAPELKAHARRDDMDTSHEAAAKISIRVRDLQLRVLRFAQIRPRGFTDPAMNDHFGNTSSTLRTRRSELVDLGFIEDTGERVLIGERRKHAVWRITEAGRQRLAEIDARMAAAA